MIRTDTATDWLDLQRLLFDDPWPERAGKYHSTLIHRGMCDSDWVLQPSLQRHGLVERERDLLRNFKKYARVVEMHTPSEWEWITIAQHHGLPTRVLDWTYSPLVALHFATANRRHAHRDGVVWSVDFAHLHERLPRKLRRAIEQEGSGAFTTQMLDGFKLDPTSDPILDEPEDFVLFFEPPSLDQRVVNQYAGLSVMSRAGSDLHAWLDAQPDEVARRVIVPAALKAEAREKLDQSNVNERVLFPTLDGLSAWLTRYYSAPPRPAFTAAAESGPGDSGAEPASAPSDEPSAPSGDDPPLGPRRSSHLEVGTPRRAARRRAAQAQGSPPTGGA